MIAALLLAAAPCLSIDMLPPIQRMMIVETVQIEPANVPGKTLIWKYPNETYQAINVTKTGCIAGQRWLTRKQADELFQAMVGGI